MSDDMFVPLLWMIHVAWFALWMLAIAVSTRIVRRQLIPVLLIFLALVAVFSAWWAFMASHGLSDANVVFPGFMFGTLLGGAWLVPAGIVALAIASVCKKSTETPAQDG